MQRLWYLPLILLLFTGSLVHAQGSPTPQLEAAVNDARASVGVARLHVDARLETSAQGKVAHMQSSHCYLPRCVNEFTAAERANAAGYPGGFVAELLDTDHATVPEVVSQWMTEGSGDRFLLTLDRFTDLGCASGMDGSTPLWVCDFGQQTGGATSTPIPPTATLQPLTATLTSVPPTSTTVPPTATIGPDEPLGECARVWYDPNGGSAARFFGRMTQFACVGF
jgi:hypothetical protein